MHLRLTAEEYRLLEQQFKSTTERKISVYARKVFLRKPMIGGYRNLTADALMIEFSKLIKDLNGVANNFNQAVHVLHTNKHHQHIHQWLSGYQADRAKLVEDIQNIKEFIHKTAGIWLQS